MDREAWEATVHGVAKSQIWLGDIWAHARIYFMELWAIQVL